MSHMFKVRTTAFAAVSTIALATICAPALAQDEAAAPPMARDTGDIIVTARRVEERLQDVPVAVTALTSAALEQQGVRAPEDLRYHVPALQITPSPFGASVPGYTIRGQRQYEQLLTQDPSVGVYFADVVAVRSHGTNSAAYDLASIQVLKGPQGTLFGRNTTGGAVLINPNRPTDRFGGSIAVEAGNYDLWRGTAIVNIPVSDTLMIRAAGQITRRDGYNRNITLGTRTDDERTESGRLSVRWKPVDGITNDIVFQYFHEDDAGVGMAAGDVNTALLLRALPPATAAATTAAAAAAVARQRGRSMHIIENDFASMAKISAYTLANTTEIVATDHLTVKNIFGFRHVLARNNLDYDGMPVVIGHTSSYVKVDQYSNELQLIGNWDRLNMIGGLYYFSESGDDIQSSILPIARVNDGYASNYSYSAYLQGGYKLTDQLTLTLGARYTLDDRKLNARSKESIYPLASSDPRAVSLAPADLRCRIVIDGVRLDPCSKKVSVSFDSPTWLASLDYKPSQDILLYAAHRRGYRSGGFNIRSLTAGQFVPFAPETVYDVEGGIKSDFFDRRLRINLAVYRQWYKDIQRAISFIPPGATLITSTILNAAKATLTGGELEVTARPIDLIQLSGNLAYVGTKYKDFRDAIGDASNNKFAWAPKWQWGGTVRLNAPLDESQGDAGAQISVYHQSAMQNNDFNGPRPIAGYTLLDFTGNWNRVMGSAFDLSVFVKNITDKEYVTSSIAQLGSPGNPPAFPARSGLGIQGESVGAPRTFGLSVRYHFGEGI